MALINLSKREIHCKIVYYGPGRCGKTTNFLYIYNAMNNKASGKMLTIETKGERILFFDLLPLNLGKINGFDIRIQLYTVPGQTIYEATRKLVLKGVDGLVFVADYLKVRHEKNIESLQDLHRNLLEHNLTLEEIPIILQFNKCDLMPTPIPTLTKEELETDLNRELKTKIFEAAATKGIGVFETLEEISKRTVHYVATKHLLTKENSHGSDKKIPDPEDFTKNVESTIDELFSASRQIEIDPLTSEVKNLSQDKTDQGPEITTDEKILELDSGLELESAIDMEVSEVAHEMSEEAVSERLVEDVKDLEPVLEDAVKSHIKVLNNCIGYILPVEKLLARTPGMEKLHHFQQNIKNRLEEQKKILEKALTGDYEPSDK